MNWIERLYQTYERCATALPPIGHITQQAHIEIVIDDKGNFRRANVVSKEESTTLVPCTEGSSGRTGKKPVNHPLCDKLQYVAGDFVDFGGEVTSGFAADPQEPNRTYLSDLSSWGQSPHGHPKMQAILRYVRKGTVVKDLIGAGVLPSEGGKLLKEYGGNRKDAPAIFKVIANPEDAFIRWRVEMPGNPSSATWNDVDLLNAWVARYAEMQNKRGLCMVTGKETILAEQHPAKIRNSGDKAKLISSNDKSGYTFRGRFLDADQACGVGFEVTQKAHNALRWLVERQAHRNGKGQIVASWAISGKPIPDPFANSFELFSVGPPERREAVEQNDCSGQAFANRLSRLIAGYRATLGSTENIVVMALDSATPGRLAITYYRDLIGSEFLNRIEAWHSAYSWPQNYGQSKKFIGAPAPREIAEAAFGRRLDDKLRKATMERLLPCIIDARPIPRDLMESAVRHASSGQGIGRREKDRRAEWEKTLGIACALFRGAFKERMYQMDLETDRKSRDYLFGQLLAVAEHIERRALSLTGEGRETTASRLMQRFADHPASTWRTIELALVPYKTRLQVKRPGTSEKMKALLDQLIFSFKGNDFIDDRRLSGEFLLGYHCQRRRLNPPKTVASSEDRSSNS